MATPKIPSIPLSKAAYQYKAELEAEVSSTMGDAFVITQMTIMKVCNNANTPNGIGLNTPDGIGVNTSMRFEDDNGRFIFEEKSITGVRSYREQSQTTGTGRVRNMVAFWSNLAGDYKATRELNPPQNQATSPIYAQQVPQNPRNGDSSGLAEIQRMSAQVSSAAAQAGASATQSSWQANTASGSTASNWQAAGDVNWKILGTGTSGSTQTPPLSQQGDWYSSNLLGHPINSSAGATDSFTGTDPFGSNLFGSNPFAGDPLFGTAGVGGATGGANQGRIILITNHPNGSRTHTLLDSPPAGRWTGSAPRQKSASEEGGLPSFGQTHYYHESSAAPAQQSQPVDKKLSQKVNAAGPSLSRPSKQPDSSQTNAGTQTDEESQSSRASRQAGRRSSSSSSSSSSSDQLGNAFLPNTNQGRTGAGRSQPSPSSSQAGPGTPSRSQINASSQTDSASSQPSSQAATTFLQGTNQGQAGAGTSQHQASPSPSQTNASNQTGSAPFQASKQTSSAKKTSTTSTQVDSGTSKQPAPLSSKQPLIPIPPAPPAAAAACEKFLLISGGPSKTAPEKQASSSSKPAEPPPPPPPRERSLFTFGSPSQAGTEKQTSASSKLSSIKPAGPPPPPPPSRNKNVTAFLGKEDSKLEGRPTSPTGGSVQLKEPKKIPLQPSRAAPALPTTPASRSGAASALPKTSTIGLSELLTKSSKLVTEDKKPEKGSGAIPKTRQTRPVESRTNNLPSQITFASARLGPSSLPKSTLEADDAKKRAHKVSEQTGVTGKQGGSGGLILTTGRGTGSIYSKQQMSEVHPKRQKDSTSRDKTRPSEDEDTSL